MSLLRRRLMMQTNHEEIPRERMKFTTAGDSVFGDGLTKYNSEPAVFGLALVTYNNSSGFYPYFVGVGDPNFGTVWVSSGRLNRYSAQGGRNTYEGRTVFYNATRYVPSFTSYEDGMEYLKSININNLPIMNTITGKAYVAAYAGSAGVYHCWDVSKDLLDYYYGVI